MSQSSEDSRSQILQELSNGDFVSGQLLADKLRLSRNAISNHVKALQQLGLDIFSVTGKGYKLAQPISLLNESKIREHLAKHKAIPLEVKNIVDSTNQYLKNKIGRLDNGHICIAEAQTAGRGRQGKAWVSPYASSIYLSCHWAFSGGYSAINGLSLAIGVAISDALDELGVEGTQLKWPNDVYLLGKKLSGVLIEVEGQMGSACHCIIGIGLNIQLPPEVKGIDQAWTDLSQHMQSLPERNEIVATMIESLLNTLKTFEESGLSVFTDSWQQKDYYKEQVVRLLLGENSVVGKNLGIDVDGALRLEVEGEVKRFMGGEISVKPV